jgi:hypothetical protein
MATDSDFEMLVIDRQVTAWRGGVPQVHAQFEVWLGDEGGQARACSLRYP